jgi:hypothetical protein
MSKKDAIKDNICKLIPKQDKLYKKAKFAEMLAERTSDLTTAGRFLKNLY